MQRPVHVVLIAFSTLSILINLIFQLLELNSLALANVCLRIKQSSPDLFNTSGNTQSDKIENQSIWQSSLSGSLKGESLPKNADFETWNYIHKYKID